MGSWRFAGYPIRFLPFRTCILYMSHNVVSAIQTTQDDCFEDDVNVHDTFHSNDAAACNNYCCCVCFDLTPGMEIGGWVALGYLTQAIGLQTTDASVCAFLCSLTVVRVPLSLSWSENGKGDDAA